MIKKQTIFTLKFDKKHIKSIREACCILNRVFYGSECKFNIEYETIRQYLDYEEEVFYIEISHDN